MASEVPKWNDDDAEQLLPCMHNERLEKSLHSTYQKQVVLLPCLPMLSSSTSLKHVRVQHHALYLIATGFIRAILQHIQTLTLHWSVYLQPEGRSTVEEHPLPALAEPRHPQSSS